MPDALSTLKTPINQFGELDPNAVRTTANDLPASQSPAAPSWPTLDELASDSAWAYELGEKYGYNDYQGKHVAILNKTIIGSGTDHVSLRQDLAKRFAVHPERIIILYIDSPYVDVEE